jgi:hypothetical protein
LRISAAQRHGVSTFASIRTVLSLFAIVSFMGLARGRSRSTSRRVLVYNGANSNSQDRHPGPMNLGGQVVAAEKMNCASLEETATSSEAEEGSRSRMGAQCQNQIDESF